MGGDKYVRDGWLNRFRRVSRGTRKAEEDIMATFDQGRRIKGSGARPISSWSMPFVAAQFFGKTRNRTAGGDGVTARYLLEHKRTHRLSFEITREILKAMTDGADRDAKMALLVISFKNPELIKNDRQLLPYMEWALLRASDLYQIADPGAVYAPVRYHVGGESFGWTRLRVRDAIASGFDGGCVPSALLHFTPVGSEVPLMDHLEAGTSEDWLLLPLFELHRLEDTTS